jgi:NADH:ubiquinone reductase (H+-translocating)
VANPAVRTLGVDLQHGDRLPTESDGSLVGHPEVFAVGDIAWTTVDGVDGALPQLGSVALQAGEHAGESIARLVAGKDTEPFRYHDKGTMATIGRGAAVAQTHGGRTLKGRTAWLAWGAVHLALLSTGEDRAKAVVDWTWAGFSHERSGRISVRTDPP